MFREVDRVNIQAIKTLLVGLSKDIHLPRELQSVSEMGIYIQALERAEGRLERIEMGQSVLKADRDADIARMTDRDIAFGEEFLAMSKRLSAIELSQRKTLSLLAVSVKSPAKSAKKRSKKP